jgi:CRISPR-associated endonuclease/helicase Cas3
MDEVQLMDVGLATSAQLQAFREEDREKVLRPCRTWWMSATLQPAWLLSVDTAPYYENWCLDPCVVDSENRTDGLWRIHKSLSTDAIGCKDDRQFAKRILAEHAEVPNGEFGRITLVVCNKVDQACRTYNALVDEGRFQDLELVHSRFRPAEREGWRERFLSRSACTPDVDRIIVATQVIEAGVDLSAGCLISELAPWPSLVQRFGRCARYGGTGKVLVIDRGRDEASTAPYDPEDLEGAWEALQQLAEQGVGIAALEAHEESLGPEARKRLYPYAPAHLVLRREFDELFDTTPDLTGADLDISRFIRSGNESDLQVFWLQLAKDELPSPEQHPHRRDLCSIPFMKARNWLCGEETKSNWKPRVRSGMRAWIWDWIDGEWIQPTRASLLPGRLVCVAAACGGYRIEGGFDSASTLPVPVPPVESLPAETEALEETDDQQDSEALSQIRGWKTIACHGKEVANEARQIVTQLGLPQDLVDILELAALWHDWGKSHPAFQGCIRDVESTKRFIRTDVAKAPVECWPRKHRYQYLDGSDTRPGFRHELASALGLFAVLQSYAPKHPALLGPWCELPTEALEKMGCSFPVEEPPAPPCPLIERLLNCKPEAFDLVAYLVASHHGKVRVGLHAGPKDQEYRLKPGDNNGLPIRGVREGDRLPMVVLVGGEPAVPAVTLTLSPAEVGLSRRTGVSWRTRCISLIDRHGPTALAFLEAILRAADVRASRLKTKDTAFEAEVSA